MVVMPSLGQGAFRVMVMDAYGRRCAMGNETAAQEIHKVGIYLTQVGPTCSMSGHGGIPTQPAGV